MMWAREREYGVGYFERHWQRIAVDLLVEMALYDDAFGSASNLIPRRRCLRFSGGGR